MGAAFEARASAAGGTAADTSAALTRWAVAALHFWGAIVPGAWRACQSREMRLKPIAALPGPSACNCSGLWKVSEALLITAGLSSVRLEHQHTPSTQVMSRPLVSPYWAVAEVTAVATVEVPRRRTSSGPRVTVGPTAMLPVGTVAS